MAIAAVAVAVAIGLMSHSMPLNAAADAFGHGDGSFSAKARHKSASATPATKVIEPPQRDLDAELALQVERALINVDPRQREITLNRLLPTLIKSDVSAVRRVIDHQDSGGPARAELLSAVTRAWIAVDKNAALTWVASLPDDGERKQVAAIATLELTHANPEQAAEQFDVNRDNGTVERLVQSWAETDLPTALNWIQALPIDDATRDPLLARVALIQADTAPSQAATLIVSRMTSADAQRDALLAVLQQWAMRDADAALTWAAQLSDGTVRDQLQKGLPLPE